MTLESFSNLGLKERPPSPPVNPYALICCMCAAIDEKSNYLYPLLALDCCIFSPDIRLWEPTSETPAFLKALGSFLLVFSKKILVVSFLPGCFL